MKIKRSASLGRSNALLFYQLAGFLVWAQQHQDTVASDPALRELLGDTALLLENAGTRIASSEA